MITVLFVDDEPALLELTRLFLERTGAMSVETCRSALEGLEILKSRTFDVIVSDYEMPLMDGIVFLKILRAEGNRTPFIVFTGKGREHVVIEALNNGADFYVQKGGSPKSQFAELSNMIEQAVQRRRTEESLQAQEQLLNEIINFLPDATFAIDSEGRVVSWNRAMEDMTGVRGADMIGKGNHEYGIPFYGNRRPLLIDLINEPEEEIRRQFYTILRKEGNVLIAETELAEPKGKKSVLWAKAMPLYDNTGNVVGAIESVRDITEFRQAEKQSIVEEKVARPDIQRERPSGLLEGLFGMNAEKWYRKGVDLYYRHGKFQDAMACFDRVIELDPRHRDAWNGRGVCLKELGRYEEAVQCFDRVIAIDPANEETWYNRGEALEKLGKQRAEFRLYEEAIVCFDKVIGINANNIHAWNYRGVCLKELRRYEEAKRSFEQAQELIRRGQDRVGHF